MSKNRRDSRSGKQAGKRKSKKNQPVPLGLESAIGSRAPDRGPGAARRSSARRGSKLASGHGNDDAMSPSLTARGHSRNLSRTQGGRSHRRQGSHSAAGGHKRTGSHSAMSEHTNLGKVQQAPYLKWDTEELLQWLKSLGLDLVWKSVEKNVRKLQMRGEDIYTLVEKEPLREIGIRSLIHRRRVSAAALQLVYAKSDISHLSDRLRTLESQLDATQRQVLILKRMSSCGVLLDRMDVWDTKRVEVPGIVILGRQGRNNCICGKYQAVLLYNDRPFYKKGSLDYVFYQDGCWRITQGLDNVGKGACAARLRTSAITPYGPFKSNRHVQWEVFHKWTEVWAEDKTVSTICMLNVRSLTHVIKQIKWISKLMNGSESVAKHILAVVYSYYHALMHLVIHQDVEEMD